MGKKYGVFSEGDVILTNPEPGFYGIAVVLDTREKTEDFLPMCHIAITPLLFQKEITMNDIDLSLLKPHIFQRYYQMNEKLVVPYRKELLIHIYTTRNKVNLPIIGKVNPKMVYDEPLLWQPQEDRFHLCGDADLFLGREAYIQWCRNNNILIHDNPV